MQLMFPLTGFLNCGRSGPANPMTALSIVEKTTRFFQVEKGNDKRQFFTVKSTKRKDEMQRTTP